MFSLASKSPVLFVVLLIGCSDQPVTNAIGNGPAKPTEDEVRREVKARATRINGQQPFTVKLLSPLFDPPATYFEKYFDRNPSLIDRKTLVACYVAISGQSKSKDGPAKDVIELVILGQDSRRGPKDGSKVVSAPSLTTEEMVRDNFGADWLAEHPWPQQ
jgi:hypothetical protein